MSCPVPCTAPSLQCPLHRPLDTVCSYRAAKRDMVADHERTHKDDKPFKCDHCECVA